MTRANNHPVSEGDDDEMLPEYDFSQFGQGVRGKHAEAMRQGYSVTVHHEDGTSTTRYVPPDHSMSQGKTYSWYGDRINGDKVSGDKVGGDKVMGNKITHYNSQNLTQVAKDIKDLLDQLDQDYDRSTPTGQAMISAKAIEAIEQNPTLKARVINALKEGGTTALESAIDHPAVKPVVAMIKGFMDAK
ncbi:MAG: hypothetical protein HC840_31880 [Leptolyngbyaceae cyanobacterium RM2_2_4]|nr:hypothetical protein [Leptolyngbyaceae cyanobacterium SM1_4_3]NJN89943.1 hypothetical protein [Leptolyngbyaceae cyanobacterium SL_5_14]NJO53244.1 hypothetical protein [Leptolyngbyaceae cyanobacterium RM2_2_4]NJO66535.1 hypothetical protein [Leptolyngbyaceae cyanobacterium RM1_405_57]